jgi:hypothetical protein
VRLIVRQTKLHCLCLGLAQNLYCFAQLISFRLQPEISARYERAERIDQIAMMGRAAHAALNPATEFIQPVHLVVRHFVTPAFTTMRKRSMADLIQFFTVPRGSCSFAAISD